jgi:uncharacterized protein YdiU (UPF0061 family)
MNTDNMSISATIDYAHGWIDNFDQTGRRTTDRQHRRRFGSSLVAHWNLACLAQAWPLRSIEPLQAACNAMRRRT